MRALGPEANSEAGEQNENAAGISGGYRLGRITTNLLSHIGYC